MKIINSLDAQVKPSVVMLVYGDGGVGKSTFSATAPKPLLADCENGSKYFGLRGIKVDIAQIEKWADMRDYMNTVSEGKYETVVIDPIGELMDKLKKHMIALGDSKLSQKDGSPSMAGWGWLKTTLRNYLKALRDMGKHVIIVAHVQEQEDEGRLIKRPKVETKLSEELVNLVDIVAFMEVIKDENNVGKRILRVDPESDKFVAKDRTGQLGKIIEPDFQKIVNACQGTATYAWSKPKEENVAKEPEAPKVDAPKDVPAGEAPKGDGIVEVKHPDEKIDNALTKICTLVAKLSDNEGAVYTEKDLLIAIKKLGVVNPEMPHSLTEARKLYAQIQRAAANK